MYINNSKYENLIKQALIQNSSTSNSALETELDSFKDILSAALKSSPDIFSYAAFESILGSGISSDDSNNFDTNDLLIDMLSMLTSSKKHTFSTSNSKSNLNKVYGSVSSYNKAQMQVNNSYVQSGQYNTAFTGDVFLGDSITKGLSAYKFLDDSKVYANVGIGINKVTDLVDSAAKQNPKRVFIMCGINDMGSLTEEEFTQQYTSLIDKVKSKCPDAKVYVQSILPVLSQAEEKNPNLNNQRINKFNSILSQVANNENVGFINTSSLANSHKDLYESDGIHYQPSFYPIWMNFIQNNIK